MVRMWPQAEYVSTSVKHVTLVSSVVELNSEYLQINE